MFIYVYGIGFLSLLMFCCFFRCRWGKREESQIEIYCRLRYRHDVFDGSLFASHRAVFHISGCPSLRLKSPELRPSESENYAIFSLLLCSAAADVAMVLRLASVATRCRCKGFSQLWHAGAHTGDRMGGKVGLASGGFHGHGGTPKMDGS